MPNCRAAEHLLDGKVLFVNAFFIEQGIVRNPFYNSGLTSLEYFRCGYTCAGDTSSSCGGTNGGNPTISTYVATGQLFDRISRDDF